MLRPGQSWVDSVRAAKDVCDGVHYLLHQQLPMKFRALAAEDVVMSSRGRRKVVPSYVIRALSKEQHHSKEQYHRDSMGVVLLRLLGVQASRDLLLELEQDYGKDFVASSASTELVNGTSGNAVWPRPMAEKAVRAALLCIDRSPHAVDAKAVKQAKHELGSILERIRRSQKVSPSAPPSCPPYSPLNAGPFQAP